VELENSKEKRDKLNPERTKGPIEWNPSGVTVVYGYLKKTQTTREKSL